MEFSGELDNPAALPANKEPPVPIGWEAGWTPKAVWIIWSRKKSLAVLQPVVSRLSYRLSYLDVGYNS
jgi:hypothetical protein